MKKYYVIESLEGGYWSEEWKAFKGFAWATRYEEGFRTYDKDDLALKAASEIEPCKLTAIYDKE